MPQAAPKYPVLSSLDVATTVMSPAHPSIQSGEQEMPIFTPEQRAANATELGLGLKVGDAKEMALSMLEGGVPLPGIQQASMVLGVPFMFWTRDFKAQRQMQDLTEQYREVIAAKTGLPAEKVDERVLLRYATQNEALAAAVKAIARERENHITHTLGGLGGMSAGSFAAGAIGGAIAGPIGLVAGLAGGFLGFNVGENIARFFTNTSDATNPKAIVEAMLKKREEGLSITAEDVFTLRAAQDEKLAEGISAKQGSPFHLLSADAKREVMAGAPLLLQQALRDAVCCNLPNADLHYLLLGEMPVVAANQNVSPEPARQPTQWISRVPANQNFPSFAAREDARRTAAEAEPDLVR